MERCNRNSVTVRANRFNRIHKSIQAPEISNHGVSVLIINFNFQLAYIHLPGLLAYVRHRITNATAEGINSKIQMLKSNARGLPKFRTLRIRVLFHCGGLDLSPVTPTH